MHNFRIKNLQTEISRAGVRGFLITSPVSIFYLSGYRFGNPREREVMMYLSEKSCILLTPAMFAQEVKHLNIVKTGVIEMYILGRGEGFLNSLKSDLTSDESIWFEPTDVSVAEYNAFIAKINCRFVDSGDVISKIREQKEEFEIESVKQAVDTSDQILAEVLDRFKHSGFRDKSEKDVVKMLWEEMLKNGIEEFSFNPIVATGANSSIPHYKPSDNILSPDQPLLIDFGIRHVSGYVSDVTRCVWLGNRVEDEYRYLYDLVLACNELCIKSFVIGMTFLDLQNLAEEFFQKHDVRDKFLHSIGHGIGLEVHEKPFVTRSDDTTPLESGSIITIEPGLYLPGKFGVRIEDLCVVRDSGLEVLTSSKFKHLQWLG